MSLPLESIDFQGEVKLLGSGRLIPLDLFSALPALYTMQQSSILFTTG